MFRASVVVVVVAMAFSAACSGGGDGAWNPDAVDLGQPRTESLPLQQVVPIHVTADGGSWARVSLEETCFAEVGDEPTCLEVGPIYPSSVSWSPDGMQLLLAEDSAGLPAAGVLLIDTSTGTVERLTGGSETAAIGVDDWQPFFGPDEQVHFFRSIDPDGEPELALHRIDETGAVQRVDGITLEPNQFPIQAARPIDGQRYVLGVGGPNNADAVVLLDLAEATVEPIDVGEARAPQITDTANGLVLIEDRNAFRFLDDPSPFWLVTADGEATRIAVPAGDRRTMLAAGFGPDASFVAGAVSPLDGDEPSGLIGYPIIEGQLGQPVTIADDEDFVGDDVFIGLGLGVELVWTPDGQLLFGGPDSTLVSFDASRS